MMPPNDPCLSCGCKPSEVQNALEIARQNIKLTDKVKRLREVLEAVAPKVDRGTQRFILSAIMGTDTKEKDNKNGKPPIETL